MNFFFSSRRRHTRYWRDWSSDVCSSDLRIEVLTDAVEVLSRVAVGREPLELAVDGVARTDLDLAVADPDVEPVQRADRRTAVDLAGEVVDAAVARADEALGGLDVPDGAAEVHAAGREGDEVRARAERRVLRAVEA